LSEGEKAVPRKTVVHTGVGPEDPRIEETRILSVPHVEFVKRGPCETPGQVLEAVRDADVAICIGEPYSREVLTHVPRLTSVVRIGVGVDTIDLDAATENGILVAYFPDFCTREVANHAIALLLGCAKKILRIDRALRNEGWDAARQLRSPMGAIHDETLGLLGLGAIGQETARLARCMGMRVIASDPLVDVAVFEENGVDSVSLEELAAGADYVSCHVPLNEGTRGLVDASFFDLMKPTAYFINTSRGAVVNESDLVMALQDGRIAGAGLDVFVQEPIPSDHPFLTMDNVVLTAHTAPYADETYRVRDRRVAHAVLTILQGNLPPFVANPEVLDHRRT
jgi:D-3-phosphoglycerate dehydrogenase